jgi:hypothetical protein
VAVASLDVLDLPQRTPELGRIRLGEKGDRGQPVKLRTFRLTSHSKALLEAAAKLYGGTVRAWTDAPDEGMWQLTTAASELDVLIPGATGAVSQNYEEWKGGTCARRCDGTTVRTPGGEEPCVCKRLGLAGSDDEHCDIVTRFRVILPRVPGLGVWMLTTSGWMAATTLPATLGLLARMTSGEWIPAVLRAEQRSKKVRLPDGKVQTNRFVVPVLDLPGATIGQLVEGAGLVDAPMLDAAQPATARDRALARAARIEATTSAPVAGSAAPVAVQGVEAPQPPTSAPAAQPSPAAAATGAGEVLADPETGEVIEGEAVEITEPAPLNPGELRDWLRGKLIGITAARERAMKLWRVDSLDRLTDEQRGALAADLEADPPA